ncbi:MAG: hypothetical protein VX527_02220 [Planctomycetota bacterium]|nr:hypothetical protein [Planctomycetota bacterium]
MRCLIMFILFLAILPAAEVRGQNALGDGQSLDANLNTRGTRNAPGGTLRPGESGNGLIAPNFRAGLATNADFSAQNLADPGAFTRAGGGLTNNPWYWQRAGTLQGEVMKSGYNGGLGGGVSARYFHGDGSDYGPRTAYSPFFRNYFQDAGKRVGFGADMDALGELNRISNTYIPPGQPGNVLQSLGASTPEGFRTPWEYTIGGPSPFLRDVRRGELMRNDLSNRELHTEPRVVGTGIDANQQMIRYTASNLRGLGAIFRGGSPIDIGMTQYDLLRAREDERDERGNRFKLGEAYETRFAPDLMEKDRISNRIQANRVGQTSPQVESVMEQMAQRYKEINPEETDLVGQFEQDYRQVQRDIAQFQIQPRVDRQAELEELLQDETEDLEAGPELPMPVTPDNIVPGEVDETGMPAELPELNYDNVGMILRHGQRVDSLAIGDKSRFDELMKAGQSKLKDREYFWAEKRFARALRFTPGHPLATAGLAHSQIGSGLHLTAALTLKSLLGFQPEMIDVVYDPSLLPDIADFERTIKEIDERIAKDEDLDDYGFLLAYIGHQLDRPELIRRGLNAMARANQDLVFTDLLTRIWLPETDVEIPPIVLPEELLEIDDDGDEVDVEEVVPEDDVEQAPIELEPLLDPDTP